MALSLNDGSDLLANGWKRSISNLAFRPSTLIPPLDRYERLRPKTLISDAPERQHRVNGLHSLAGIECRARARLWNETR
jgi:hypothetical protein